MPPSLPTAQTEILQPTPSPSTHIMFADLKLLRIQPFSHLFLRSPQHFARALRDHSRALSLSGKPSDSLRLLGSRVSANLWGRILLLHTCRTSIVWSDRRESMRIEESPCLPRISWMRTVSLTAPTDERLWNFKTDPSYFDRVRNMLNLRASSIIMIFRVGLSSFRTLCIMSDQRECCLYILHTIPLTDRPREQAEWRNQFFTWTSLLMMESRLYEPIGRPHFYDFS